MLAVVVLASALTVMVGDFLTAQQLRDFAREQVMAQEIGRSLLMRLQGAPVSRLGVVTDRWGIARHEDAGDPPLVDRVGADANDDLVALGVRTTRGNLDDLQVFVEYYRGIASSDPSTGLPAILPGVMDGFAVDADPVVSYTQYSDAAWRTPRRLAGGLSPAAQVPTNTPIVIRVIVLWDQTNRIELYGGRLF